MSVALLFPGQGAQKAHMLDAVPDTPAGRAVLASARQTIEHLAPAVDLDDPGRDTVATQLALVTVGVACGRALVDDGGLEVAFVAGHSVGAFAAAVVAGVLTLPEALTAVHERALSMASVCSTADWGMAAVLGLPPSASTQIAADMATFDVWLANVNSASQTVFAGTAAGLAKLEEQVRRAGARAFERLDVDIASHGVLQEPTAAALTECLRAVSAQPPTMRYPTNVGGRVVNTAEAVVNDLIRSVARTVRWYDSVRLMGELGVTCAVEVIPGHTLSRLVNATDRDVTTLALSEVDFATVVARAGHHGG